MWNLKILAITGALVATSLVGTIWYAYSKGKQSGQDSVQIRWERDKVAHARALAAQEAAHRTIERKWGDAITSVSAWHRAAQEALQDDYENTIAGLESGHFRLRRDLAGCSQQLPSDSTPTPGDHGGGGGGLSAARQGVVVRIGAECDAIAHKLTAAQEYIRAIQQTPQPQ
jgi:hypothetical protein